MDPITLYGGAFSLYTGRVRSYLIKSKIDYREEPHSSAYFYDVVLPKAGGRRGIPTIEFPTGDVIRDGVAIIEATADYAFVGINRSVPTIEGNEVKFRSASKLLADNVPFTFSGTVTGDSMSGNIHHGEYLTSKFSAKKYIQPSSRQKIVVPSGPPLSS